MLIVTGSATARPETIAEMTALALEHVRRSRAEPGCLSHEVHIDAENPLRLTFLERWADDAALAAHFALPASKDFVRRLRALSASSGAIEIYHTTRVTL